MIGKLKGIVESKSTHDVLLDVNGVCYEIELPLSAAFSLPAVGEAVSLHTHFVVREDAQLLYGFSSLQDRDTFRVLIKVNGVGPKLGIAILSGLSAADLARCVELEDVSALVKLPGIGKKTAERLLIELRDKLSSLAGEQSVGSVLSAAVAAKDISSEAESALIGLGYKPVEAAKAIKQHAGEGLELEALIRACLKGLM
jgi:Holliday junction DNA helicase RuvA